MSSSLTIELTRDLPIYTILKKDLKWRNREKWEFVPGLFTFSSLKLDPELSTHKICFEMVTEQKDSGLRSVLESGSQRRRRFTHNNTFNLFYHIYVP